MSESRYLKRSTDCLMKLANISSTFAFQKIHIEMSLVAYGSSDEESENEEIEDQPKIETSSSKPSLAATQSIVAPSTSSGVNKLSLPAPAVVQSNVDDIEDDEDTPKPSFQLNLPKPTSASSGRIIEEDDEFLRKKPLPETIERPPPAPKATKRQPVKIMIQSLSELGAIDNKPKLGPVFPTTAKPTGLLNMLRDPKGHRNFLKTPSSTGVATKTTSLIPHSVANRQKPPAKKPSAKASTSTSSSKSLISTAYVDSDASDDSGAEDFFSLSKEDKLPEVSANEINLMVAKRAAKMAEASSRFKQNVEEETNEEPEIDQETATMSNAQSSQREMDIQALCGTRAAKRARKEQINFIELSHEEVLPNRGEWLRNHLQQETEYQPRGLVDTAEPGTGTRKKHQITYLAYQAKANEAELQAMWAANRQSRRATQSKYGF